jgi:MerR family mercuric resistance operon transcriptional regulator
MVTALESMSIGAMAGMAGVGVETVRFYQRKGLLRQPRRGRGEIRRYSSKDVARVKFIKAAQHLGFTLGDVAELLTLEDGRHCDEARSMAELRLQDVRRKLHELRQMESALQTMVERCCATEERMACPLIVALQVDARRAS